MRDVQVFLEPCDVARAIDRSASYVRLLAATGRLPIAAKTRRGCRLFSADDVATLKKELGKPRRGRAA